MGAKIYPVLDLTGRGYEVMAGRQVVLLTRPMEEPRGAFQEQPRGQKPEREVFDRLRDLRASLARKERLPAYCIFQDRTLREMARTIPGTPDELLGIVGVGQVTLRKYGRQFLRLLDKIRNESSSL